MVVKAVVKRKKIGKYTIQRQIGKGSAANIFLARQDALGRKLVIKELLPVHAANEKIINRFQREAKIVSQFSHDAIVHIYDYWVRGNSRYIAMEYVQGKTLFEILASVKFVPVHIAAIIIYQVCRGLQHAHAQGVVHRDLKPSNIIISQNGHVKVLDFGIAHYQYDENLTSLGAIIGTYHYMSPEQALGKQVAQTSDIFTLGIVFYELLTGHKPFIRDEKGDILEKIVNKGFRSPLKLNPAIPYVFGRIIKKCLRKKSKRRHKSTETIKLKLEKYLKRYSLDHQLILKNYLQDLTPRKLDENWPPRFWRRVWYRSTHLRARTYIWIVLALFTFGFAEYWMISQDIGPKRQWRYLKRRIQMIFDTHEKQNDDPVDLPDGQQKQGVDSNKSEISGWENTRKDFVNRLKG